MRKCAKVKSSLGQASPISTATLARKRVSCLVKHFPNWKWECNIQKKTCLTCQRHESILKKDLKSARLIPVLIALLYPNSIIHLD